MSKMTILTPDSCLCSWEAAVLSFLLNCLASVLKLETQPFSCCPKMVLARGTQPVGASDVAPILLAPSPYRFCACPTSEIYGVSEAFFVYIYVYGGNELTLTKEEKMLMR